MFASRAGSIVFALILSLTLVLGLTPAAAAAAETAPVPSSMAAVGDSITQAASTAGSLGADAPQNSWSTGWSTSVDSHAERLGLPTTSAHNLSVSGAKVGNLRAQMVNVAGLTPDPGYLTVLIGGNDLCTDTVESMTSESAFESAFKDAMSTLYAQSSGTYVYVVSIPDVYQLWKLFKGNFWARFIWSSADICQSLLANPTSTKKVDEDRRLAVRARNQAYNAIMASICDSTAFRSRCHHDQGAVFNTQLVASDVSGDYFHPSASGQNRLAQRSWEAGFRFGNASPTASFTHGCTDLSCSFDGSSSSDSDGTVASYAWDFGDGSTATGADATHAYVAAGTYTVTLTVTDNGGATGTTSQSVTVKAAGGNASPTASFTHACTDLSCSFNGSASADSDGTLAGYAWTFGVGSTASGSTTTHTYAAAGTYTVTLTVTDNGGATGTTSQSVTVSSPPVEITLSVTAYKLRGLQKADLTWSLVPGADVNILRDGNLLATTADDGSFTDNIDVKGGGSYTYQVCEVLPPTACSNVVVASY